MSAAVDQTLDRAEQAEFAEHCRHCVRCSSEYELERATKFMVQTKMQFVETPARVRTAILERIHSESLASVPASAKLEGAFHRFLDLFTPRHVMPAVGLTLIIAVIVGVAIVSSPIWKSTPASDGSSITLAGDENDVLHQAVNNFHDVTRGKIAVQLSSSEPSAVKAFLKDKVNFSVDVHHLRNAELIGAAYSEYRGVKIAHVIYKSGEHVIYVYQTGMKEIGNGSGLCARREIQDAIARKSFFMDSITTPPHHCSTVVWEERGTLCSAVSTLPRNEMLTTLTDQSDPDPR